MQASRPRVGRRVLVAAEAASLAPPSRCAPGSRGTAWPASVQPRARGRLRVVALVQASERPLGRVRPVAGRAGHRHRRAVPVHRRVDALRGVAAEAVAPRRSQAGLVAEELVAGEAVHPPCRGRARRGRGGSRRSAPRSARSRACSRRGSARTRSCAPRSGSGAARGRHLRPAGSCEKWHSAQEPISTPPCPAGLAEEERAEHRDALVRPRVVAALARDGLVRAAHPERELRARLVAGRAEARILVHVALEAPSAGEGSRDGQRGEGEHQRSSRSVRVEAPRF